MGKEFFVREFVRTQDVGVKCAVKKSDYLMNVTAKTKFRYSTDTEGKRYVSGKDTSVSCAEFMDCDQCRECLKKTEESVRAEMEPKDKSILRLIFPIMFCICAFEAPEIPVYLKNIPELAVHFFVWMFVSFILWGIMYVVDMFFLSKLDEWAENKVGTDKRWKRVIGTFTRLLVYFAAVLVLCGFIHSAFGVAPEGAENYLT